MKPEKATEFEDSKAKFCVSCANEIAANNLGGQVRAMTARISELEAALEEARLPRQHDRLLSEARLATIKRLCSQLEANKNLAMANDAMLSESERQADELRRKLAAAELSLRTLTEERDVEIKRARIAESEVARLKRESAEAFAEFLATTGQWGEAMKQLQMSRFRAALAAPADAGEE